MPPFRFTAVCAALLLAANAPAQALHKCVGPDGKTVFQDTACTGQGGPATAKPASGKGNAPNSKPTAPAAPPATPQGGTGSPATSAAAPVAPPVTPLK